MKRKRPTHLVLLGSAAVLVGCGFSPRSEFMVIRDRSLSPTPGDGTSLVAADLPISARGLGRSEGALADGSAR